jgi:hypothetical protein
MHLAAPPASLFDFTETSVRLPRNPHLVVGVENVEVDMSVCNNRSFDTHGSVCRSFVCGQLWNASLYFKQRVLVQALNFMLDSLNRFERPLIGGGRRSTHTLLDMQRHGDWAEKRRGPNTRARVAASWALPGGKSKIPARIRNRRRGHTCYCDRTSGSPT